jgi:hypothetical protein
VACMLQRQAAMTMKPRLRVFTPTALKAINATRMMSPDRIPNGSLTLSRCTSCCWEAVGVAGLAEHFPRLG